MITEQIVNSILKYLESNATLITSSKAEKAGIVRILQDTMCDSIDNYAVVELGYELSEISDSLLEHAVENGWHELGISATLVDFGDSDAGLTHDFVIADDIENPLVFLVRKTFVSHDFFPYTEMFIVAKRGSNDCGEQIKFLISSIIKNGYERHRNRIQGSKEIKDRLILNGDLKEDVISKIDDFINNKEFFKKHNIPYKLGILLHGPPGNGKTSLIKFLSEYYETPAETINSFIAQDGSINLPSGDFITRGRGGTEAYTLSVRECYEIYRRDNLGISFASSDTPRLIYFEDMEKTIVSDSEQSGASMRLSAFLNALDGVEKVHNVVIIATTNNIKSLKDSITKRPGRFDVVVEVGLPSKESIAKLFDHFRLQIGEDNLNDIYINSLTGYSMAFVELFIKRCLFQSKDQDYVSVDVADASLKEIKDHNKEVDGPGGSIGF